MPADKFLPKRHSQSKWRVGKTLRLPIEMQCICSPQSQTVLFGVFAKIHTLCNFIKAYMHSLLFMLLKFRQCSKTDNARATNEVLKGCHGIINALKLNK